MYFISTRNKDIRKTFSEAIQAGLAEDGGLFVPEYIPKIDLQEFKSELSYPEFACKVLQTFIENELSDEALLKICEQAFSFPLPLTTLSANTFILELFHGPTSSFKDFGARFLAEYMNAISSNRKTTIMVATSGDTGSAVASAFYQKPNINVVILYPDKKISSIQEHQITCWDKNILALCVEGSFDDCQRLVKSAFQNPVMREKLNLSSANSINIGRLLPQIIYYAYPAMQLYHHKKGPTGFVVPTGNLGNATAGYYAKLMGFPVREIALATNANKVISDYLETGVFQPRPSIATLANAMDVGNPSNFERLQYLFNTYDKFKANVTAFSVNDDEIRHTIADVYQDYQKMICPHTATGFFARKNLSDQSWIVAATADAGKFANIVEPIVKTSIPVSSQLKNMLEKPVRILKVGNTLEAVNEAIEKNSGVV